MWHYMTIMLPSERLLFCDLVTPIPRATGLGPPYSARKSEKPVSCTLQPGYSGLSLHSAGKQRKEILCCPAQREDLHDHSLLQVKECPCKNVSAQQNSKRPARTWQITGELGLPSAQQLVVVPGDLKGHLSLQMSLRLVPNSKWG